MAKRKSKPVLPVGARVLTLDVASAVGFAYGVNGKVVRYGKYVSDTGEEFGKRLHKLSKWLSKTINGLPEPPEVVLVELPYLGRNARTHAVLNRYIGIVQREVYRILGIECQFMTPREAKTLMKLPKTKSHVQAKKAMIRKINRLLGLDLKYVAGRSKKSKRSDDDVADALGLLVAYWLKHGVIEDATEASIL